LAANRSIARVLRILRAFIAIAAVGATAEFRRTQSFKPGRPVPTHRIATAVGDTESP